MASEKSENLHPSVGHVLRLFDQDRYLPDAMKEVGSPFNALAIEIAIRSSSPETTVALRKLLEAKDAAIRASVD